MDIMINAFLGTHFPFHQKPSLTKMTPFHKEKGA